MKLTIINPDAPSFNESVGISEERADDYDNEVTIDTLLEILCLPFTNNLFSLSPGNYRQSITLQLN